MFPDNWREESRPLDAPIDGAVELLRPLPVRDRTKDRVEDCSIEGFGNPRVCKLLQAQVKDASSILVTACAKRLRTAGPGSGSRSRRLRESMALAQSHGTFVQAVFIHRDREQVQRACRQGPQCAAVDGKPSRAVHRLAKRAYQGLRILLRVHRRRHQPVAAEQSVPQYHADKAPISASPPENLISAMADEAIGRIKMLNEVQPDRPFMIYYAPGGTHSPTPSDKRVGVDKISALHLFDESWTKLWGPTDLRQPEETRCDP